MENFIEKATELLESLRELSYTPLMDHLIQMYEEQGKQKLVYDILKYGVFPDFMIYGSKQDVIDCGVFKIYVTPMMFKDRIIHIEPISKVGIFDSFSDCQEKYNLDWFTPSKYSFMNTNIFKSC